MIELDSDWIEFTRFIESVHNKALIASVKSLHMHNYDKASTGQGSGIFNSTSYTSWTRLDWALVQVSSISLARIYLPAASQF